MAKTCKEAYELMKKLTSNHHQIVYKRTVRKPRLENLQIDVFSALYAQISSLSEHVPSL